MSVRPNLSRIEAPPTGSWFQLLLKLETGARVSGSSEIEVEKYLFEKYAVDSSNWKRKIYYAVKPVIPRPIQLQLRKKYTQMQAAAQQFPAWPIEPILVDALQSFIRNTIQENTSQAVYHIPLWPDGKRFAFVITHDVEGDSGLANVFRLTEIEKSLGFSSSWNIVPERYPIDFKIIDKLRSDGFEIGIHGLKHDGKLFQSRRVFEERLIKIHRYAREWGAVGFRSPSTLRNAEWMRLLEFEYDSSFPDTDPYEPQPGGCCSIWPFFIGNVVELPLTLPQDHTLFEILGKNDIGIWRQKADSIQQHSGIAVLNVHPDYMQSSDRLRLYEELLLYMREKENMWHVLPRVSAQWWRERGALQLAKVDDEYRFHGKISGSFNFKEELLSIV